MEPARALDGGADKPGRRSLEDSTFSRVSGDVAHKPKQLPKHPAAVSIETLSLAEALEISVEGGIVPPVHLVPRQAKVGDQAVGRDLQRRQPPIIVART